MANFLLVFLTGQSGLTSIRQRPIQTKDQSAKQATSCLSDKNEQNTHKHSKLSAESNLNRPHEQAENAAVPDKRVKFVDRPIFIPNTNYEATQGMYCVHHDKFYIDSVGSREFCVIILNSHYLYFYQRSTNRWDSENEKIAFGKCWSTAEKNKNTATVDRVESKPWTKWAWCSFEHHQPISTNLSCTLLIDRKTPFNGGWWWKMILFIFLCMNQKLF